MSEYPKVMQHPTHTPAVIGPRSVDAHGWENYGQGTPERLPPITVNSSEQEEEARAKGYRLPDEPLPQHQWHEYPKWVGGALVNNYDEERADRQAGVPSQQAADAILATTRPVTAAVVDEVRGWFRDIIPEGKPVPTKDHCENFARLIELALAAKKNATSPPDLEAKRILTSEAAREARALFRSLDSAIDKLKAAGEVAPTHIIDLMSALRGFIDREAKPKTAGRHQEPGHAIRNLWMPEILKALRDAGWKEPNSKYADGVAMRIFKTGVERMWPVAPGTKPPSSDNVLRQGRRRAQRRRISP